MKKFKIFCMKYKFFNSIIVLGIGSALLMTSCSKQIDDAYVNPNAAVVQPIESILPGVIGGFSAFYSSAGTGFGLQNDGILLGRYVQFWGTQTNAENYGQMGGTISSDNTGSV